VHGGTHTITGNRCSDTQGTKTQDYGIEVYSDSGIVAFLSGNSCSSHQIGNYSLGGSATIIKSAESKLAATTVNSTQTTIAHGLGYTPRLVQILPTSAGQVWQSQAATSTNIYLTADADGRTADVWVG
jgi:hypothetical protein